MTTLHLQFLLSSGRPSGVRRVSRVRAALRSMVMAIYLYCGYVQVRDLILSLLGRSRAVAVYYHRIGGRDTLSKPVDEFRRDLQYLKKHYTCVTFQEFCRILQLGLPRKRPIAAVTFDDGYRDNCLHALPVLKEAGIPATFFVSTGFIGTHRVFAHDAREAAARGHIADASAHPKLTWDDLRGMQDAGMEIGSHTVNHANIGKCDPATMAQELGESLETLQRELGPRPRAFSFPWGKPADMTDAAFQLARDLGYYAAASAYGGKNAVGNDSFHIRRVDVGNGQMSALAVRARIAGFDPDYWRIARSARRIGNLACTIVMMIAMTLPAYAATIHVSPAGNDNNDGSETQPLAAIESALSIARLDDTIQLSPGEYRINHFIWIDKPGITIRSAPGGRARIVAPTSESAGVQSVIVIVADRVSLENLELVGGAYYGLKIEPQDGKPLSGVRVRNCRIRDTGRDCVKTTFADDLLIEDCEIGPSGVRDSSNAEGIDSIGSKGVIIRRCYVHDTATNGIYLKGAASGGLIEACRVENIKGFSGILLGQETDEQWMRDGQKYEAIDCIARNNLVINTGAAGLGTYSGRNVRFENNTLVNVASRIQAAFWVVAGSRHVAPRDITFRNNIVITSGKRPMAYIGSLDGPLTCDSNLYFSRGQIFFWTEGLPDNRSFAQLGFAQWQKRMNADSRSLIADPKLEVDELYRPGPGSPAIGAGQPIAGLVSDYSGKPRPQASFDIGAHQFAPAEPAARMPPAQLIGGETAR